MMISNTWRFTTFKKLALTCRQSEQLHPGQLVQQSWLMRSVKMQLSSRAALTVGLKVMLNLAPAAPIPPEILGLIDYLLVNELEGRTIASIAELDHLPSNQLPQRLAQRYGLTCVLTLGGKGAIAADPDSVWRVPALKIKQIVDTTGAGDAFAGCFAAALTRGEETRAALNFAVVGAGLSCTTLGAQPSFPTGGAINSVRLQK